MLYDERDYGGTDGIYTSKLQGPMGIIDQPLNLQLRDRGLDVPFLDAQLKLDPDRRLLSWDHYDTPSPRTYNSAAPKGPAF